MEHDRHADTRGGFARTFCDAEFAAAGIAMRPVQANLSSNPRRGTLRGLHYQADPNGEPKLVQCVRGRIFDVAVDLRRESSTYRQWAGVELAPELGRSLYIPLGCAHGFVTLVNDTEIMYLMGAPYVAGSGRGVRWNDPAFAIAWPIAPIELSERDATYPDHDG